MIPGDLLSACPHRGFHTLPGLLDSWAALSDPNPHALRAKQGGSLYHFVRESDTLTTKLTRYGFGSYIAGACCADTLKRKLYDNFLINSKYNCDT